MTTRTNISIEVITPLTIGEDNVWKRGVDYVYKDGKIYHLDLNKMMAAHLSPDRVAALLASQDEKGLLTLLGNRLAQCSDRIIDIPVRYPQDVRTFIRSGVENKPYIPGSSLKGAIRSVLFGEWKEASNNEREVFGNMSDGSDFMRFVRVGDAAFDTTELVNTKIYNLIGGGNDWSGGWKHGGKNSSEDFKPDGFNTVYECLPVGGKAVGNISIDAELFHLYERFGKNPQPMTDKKRNLLGIGDDDDYYGYSPVENLFNIISNRTFDYLEQELAFFKAYPEGDFSDRIRQCIVRLQNMANSCIESGDSCLLKMAAGSGFHSITGNWQYDDFTQTGTDPKTGKKNKKSRKIAIKGEQFYLMGFVKLKILNS